MAETYLPYGVDDDGHLVYIDQVSRGRTALACPYCGVRLIARKGKFVVPHFAHDGQTCRSVSRSLEEIALPCYDSFYSHIPAKARSLLREWYRINISDDDVDKARRVHLYREDIESLERLGLIKQAYNYWRGWNGHELTHAGKVPFGLLSLNLFNQFQAPLLKERLEQLHETAYKAVGTADQHTAETDLAIYRAQLNRVQSAALYFIEVRVDGLTLHKIGVTMRPIEQRIEEIARDLAPYFGKVKPMLVRAWPKMGAVERYFKHRYRRFQYKIGSLTEYFEFKDVKPVRRDLARMKPVQIGGAE